MPEWEMIDCGGESIRHFVPPSAIPSLLFPPHFVAEGVYCVLLLDMGDTFPPQHSPIFFFLFSYSSFSFSSLDSLPLPANYKCVPTNEPQRARRESSSGNRVSQLQSASNTTTSFENRRSRHEISLKNRSWQHDNQETYIDYRIGSSSSDYSTRRRRMNLRASCNDRGKRRKKEGTAQTSGDFFT